MATAPWWTEADQAETNLAVWVLVGALEAMPAGHPLRAVIIQATIDWYVGRCLASRAEWFRRQHLLALLGDLETERRAA